MNIWKDLTLVLLGIIVGVFMVASISQDIEKEHLEMVVKVGAMQVGDKVYEVKERTADTTKIESYISSKR